MKNNFKNLFLKNYFFKLSSKTITWLSFLFFSFELSATNFWTCLHILTMNTTSQTIYFLFYWLENMNFLKQMIKDEVSTAKSSLKEWFLSLGHINPTGETRWHPIILASFDKVSQPAPYRLGQPNMRRGARFHIQFHRSASSFLR